MPARRIAPAPRARHARMVDVLVDFLRHACRRWYLYGPLLAIWTAAYLRLFFPATLQVPLLFNWTPSLPYRVALLLPVARPLARGDFVLYRFDGPMQVQFPGLRGQPFFKQVAGLPGDVVTVDGRTVAINGVAVGRAKRRTFDGRPLAPIAPQVIPPGHYFVAGASDDSFDSRYADSGLVRAEQLLGRVQPWF